MRVLVRSLALLAGLLLISFVLPRALPGDPLDAMVQGGGQDTPFVLSPESRRQLSAYYGLDRPLPAQVGHFLFETARGDLGFSISYGRPVGRLILERLPWTLLLVGLSLFAAGLLGSGLGLLAAWRNRSPGIRRLGVFLLLTGSLPDFVTGILLILLLGVWLPVLPVAGATTMFQACGGILPALACGADILSHAALPVLTLALVQLPAFFLLMRAAALAELGQPYILAARARGLGALAVAVRHVGRNAALPIITMLGLRLGALLGGVVVVETLFAYPGLGQLTYQAALARDFPVLQALLLLGGLAILVINAGADVVRRRIDPRLRPEAA